MAIEKTNASSSLVEVVDRILDKGIVIDLWARISLVGIELLSVELRTIIASVETYLKYAEAVGLTATGSRPMVKGIIEGEKPQEILAQPIAELQDEKLSISEITNLYNSFEKIEVGDNLVDSMEKRQLGKVEEASTLNEEPANGTSEEFEESQLGEAKEASTLNEESEDGISEEFEEKSLEINTEETEESTIELHYKTRAKNTYIFYNADELGWTEDKGKRMNASNLYKDAKCILIPASKLEFAIRNGKNKWNNNDQQNYLISAPGKYLLVNGEIKRI